MRSKIEKLDLEGIRRKLLDCFWPEGVPLKADGSRILGYLAPHLYKPDFSSDANEAAVAEAATIRENLYSVLNIDRWGIQNVTKPFERIFQVELDNGSWVLFYKDLKKAVIAHSNGISDRARSLATVLMSAAKWYDSPDASLNIKDAGICPSDGPTAEQIRCFDEPGAERSFRSRFPARLGSGAFATATDWARTRRPAFLASGITEFSSRLPGRLSVRAATARVGGWARDHGPALLAGLAAGGAVRLGAHFALAALVTTTPGFAVAAASAVAVGALAGGATKLAAAYFDKEKRRQPGWAHKAFAQGAVTGAIGGGVGFAIADYFLPEGVLHNLLHAHQPAAPVVPEPAVVPEALTPHPLPPLQEAPIVSAPPVVPPPPESVSDILSADELNKLSQSPRLRRLAILSKPADIIHACKEASFFFMNGHHRSVEDLQCGVRLIEHALKLADQEGIRNYTVEQLHADKAFANAWGWGTIQNKLEAIRQARLAGSAVNNYGPKLLRFLRAPALA